MKSKKILSVLMAAGLAFTLVGCGNSNSNSSSQNSNQPADYVEGVSLDKPMKVDKEAGTVTVLTKVNGKYFEQSTRHNSVEQSGTNGAKSIFTAYAKPEEFYNALIEIGAQPGNNMTPNNGETTHVEGTKIKAEVTWNGAGKKYDSCPVGVISNETYTYGAIEKRKEVVFTGNSDVLPEDGTYVAVIYSIEK